jgi:hypothetical protein
MKPVWCMINQIPFENMWDDASYWLPLVLEGKRIKASFVYKDDHETLVKRRLRSGMASTTNSYPCTKVVTEGKSS